MVRAFHRSLVVSVALLAVLAGCDESAMPGFLRGDKPADAPEEGGPAAASIVEKDVEAPDVFAANEAGLWDGRPSLGGVWIAHPQVADPERVLIRNPANGRSVVGAVFRRERDNPGPRIQVSSDAADSLGMLAGQPTVLDVVALRREQVEIPVPEQETGDTPDETVALAEATGSGIAASSLDDPVAQAEAAITAAENGGAATAPVPVAQGSTLDKPYIQIGIFSVEANAKNTAESLRGIGVIPTVRAQESSGKRFWRVLVGPATSEADRRGVLTKVREFGFEDAYYVTN